jgi:hypothetical protein
MWPRCIYSTAGLLVARALGSICRIHFQLGVIAAGAPTFIVYSRLLPTCKGDWTTPESQLLSAVQPCYASQFTACHMLEEPCKECLFGFLSEFNYFI